MRQFGPRDAPQRSVSSDGRGPLLRIRRSERPGDVERDVLGPVVRRERVAKGSGGRIGQSFQVVLSSPTRDNECRIPARQDVASMKGRLVMKIQGSVALVTGSNRGLGKALVSALLEAGAIKVYAAARDVSKVVQALRPELRGRNIEILAAFPGPIDTDMVRDLPIPKASPADVASAVLAGVARGEEDIFPDPMAQQMGAVWSTSPKQYERAFASM
jgi:hypothetical protein